MLTAKHGPTEGNTQMIPKAGCGTAALWDKRLRFYCTLLINHFSLSRDGKIQAI